VASFPAAFYSTASWRFLEECPAKWFAERFRGASCKGSFACTNLYSMAPDLFQVSGFYTAGDHFCNSGRCCVPSGVSVEPTQKSAKPPCAKANTGISGAIIAIDRAPERSNCETAGKYEILEIFIRSRKKWRTSCPSLAACNTLPPGTETIRESAFPAKRDIDNCLGYQSKSGDISQLCEIGLHEFLRNVRMDAC
jgi:hypothetical protein